MPARQKQSNRRFKDLFSVAVAQAGHAEEAFARMAKEQGAQRMPSCKATALGPSTAHWLGAISSSSGMMKLARYTGAKRKESSNG